MIHANGPTKRILNSLGNYLAKAYNKDDQCTSCWEDNIVFDELPEVPQVRHQLKTLVMHWCVVICCQFVHINRSSWPYSLSNPLPSLMSSLPKSLSWTIQRPRLTSSSTTLRNTMRIMWRSSWTRMEIATIQWRISRQSIKSRKGQLEMRDWRSVFRQNVTITSGNFQFNRDKMNSLYY